MERLKWPAMSGLILGTIVTSNAARTTFALDKVIHTSIATLAITGAAVLGLRSWVRRGNRDRSLRGQQYTLVPLNEIGQPHPSRAPSPFPAQNVGSPHGSRNLQIFFVLLVAACCLRVGILHEVTRNIQCSGQSWAPLLPLAFAAWDYWTIRWKRRTMGQGGYGEDDEDEDDAEISIYEALGRFVASRPYIILLAVAMVTFSLMLALRSTSLPRSTFICAADSTNRWVVPLLEKFGTLLDVLAIFCLSQLCGFQETRDALDLGLRFAYVGWASLCSSAMLLIIGIVYFLVQEQDRSWILTIPRQYFLSVLKFDVYIAFTFLSALVTISCTGATTTCLLVVFSTITTITTTSAWMNWQPFPPLPIGWTYLGMCSAILGLIAYSRLETLSNSRRSKFPNRVLFYRAPAAFYVVLLILFFIWTRLWASRQSEVNYHPIDKLAYEAEAHHQIYLAQTSTSTTLYEAMQTYLSRYNRPSPPGFEHWYKYATEHNSTVIDDFDSVERDLLPFWALSSEMIRERTWELISNPWNDVAGISIRDGKASVMPNTVPTHAWMLDGVVEMISKFSQWLPDMDLAFNINDEPRVAVPFDRIEPLRQRGKEASQPQEPEPSFSQDRAQQWKPVPEEPRSDTPLHEISWQQTFHRFGNIGCAQGAPARSARAWDWSSLCTSCIDRQSHGAFLANWTLAADICHQPDLADLHGLYLSPAAFKGTHELYPIFSQSKVHGFNDILYPSAWNYLEKVTYAPNTDFPDRPFPEKNSNLFWRGATSEGFSHRGQWRGMTRQRFIHLANGIESSAPPQPLLLPDGTGQKLSYQYLPIRKLRELLATDVHVVEDIARCAGKDCVEQAREFAPFAPRMDFQQHWQYKFLLDLDGAGFSGRFLAFLHSRSLPFKAALFREWWDDRLTPWLHFVPLDIRGHGFWATLAYFQGLDGVLKGQAREGSDAADAAAVEEKVNVDAHARNAERIADQGRVWARRVLRREDMEIYMFRLLLEWGRLTDDGRDVLR